MWADTVKAIGRIGWGRFAVTLALLVAAILIARLSWHVALSQQAERWMYDARAVITAPVAPQDPRLVQIVYDDDTLEHTGRRSPLDRGLLARALAHIDTMGARAIGIDMLIDEPQPEDAQLLAALKAMHTPTYLGFTTNAAVGDEMKGWQETFERRLFARLDGSNVHPASIKLEADPEDQFVRSWPKADPTLPPTLVSSLLGGAGTYADYYGSIAFHRPQGDDPLFTYIPIEFLDNAATTPFLAPQIAGRYVLIGGRISDIDQFDTPLTRLLGKRANDPDPRISGLDIHAMMLAQRLDGIRFTPLSPALLWALAFVVVLAGAALGSLDIGGWRIAALLGLSVLVIVLLPVGLQNWSFDTQGLPAFGWLVGWTLAYIAAASAARGVGSEQRRFAQGALGRYLPRDVAATILKNPDQLKLHGERTTIYALFSDMEGFTKLTHAIDPEQLSDLLNRYLDVLSNVVLAHGGTIDKFVGDAVVAFWGAPIARPDDGDRALAAAIAMAEAGEAFRTSAPAGLPPIGRTRVGLHRGEAVVGNFGGEGRIQYTALGDAMNAASRMEGANKTLGTRALVSAEAAAGMTEPRLRPMGRITVRGRSTPITVFEPATEAEYAQSDTLVDILARFDGADLTALDDLARYAATQPSDIALAKLLDRLRKIGPGGTYALD
ncbi:adenylate/guanylate cyclase domain-containing protein [Sphingomonas sp. CGMCC 1.13654]|uniref:Adenylate/guanylate cyclase domain-containing protein n=1 Tax=Sphingomonas chungangi TaxID=2683589 RepID=A0A838L195_9SPHN|nr:adenylate/guanylate cyclase domain-containing protein [Sphingomonas chungangi]MBA2933263.1 adenylate/guanylate cyclase domain-containing protein [Sphingomonas chungangi]MVW57933.1 CHASE2 domain-containing protein [Sphingomonas chungangi]